MELKYSIPEGEVAPPSQIGASLESLASTIEARREAGSESYTHGLLDGPLDKLLKKVMEEAGEVALAAKDVQAIEESSMEGSSAALDHLRYESADVISHLLVLLERMGISITELAAELNTRMEDQEKPAGGVILHPEHVNRG